MGILKIASASAAAGGMAAIMGVFLLIYILALAFSVVCYVLESVGRYSIAKRRGLRYAWLSWLPVGRDWMDGCISDQYQYVARGKVRYMRFILLALGAAGTVLGIAFSSKAAGMLAEFAQKVQYVTEEESIELLASMVLSFAAAGAAAGLISISLTVCRFVALYDLYRSCTRDAVLYLVLSILLQVTRPFLIFACRNKEEGMPPRRPEDPGNQIPHRTVPDPWE